MPKDYRRFCKSLKDRGLWQHEQYINSKTSAGPSEVELRELMPQCVLDDTRRRYPNPPGVPHTGHKRACKRKDGELDDTSVLTYCLFPLPDL